LCALCVLGAVRVGGAAVWRMTGGGAEATPYGGVRCGLGDDCVTKPWSDVTTNQQPQQRLKIDLTASIHFLRVSFARKADNTFKTH
jgi:hypothetical protein